MRIWIKIIIINTILTFTYASHCNNIFAQQVNSFFQDSILERQYSSQGREEARKGDFEKAEWFLNRSIEIAKKIYGKEDPILIQLFMNLGIQQKYLGKNNDALLNYNNAESLIKKNFGEKNSRLGILYNNIGNIYTLKGDYAKSLEYQESAIRYLSIDSLRFESALKQTEFSRTVSLINLKRTDEAIRIAQKHIKGKYAPLKIRYYDLLAGIYTEQGNQSLANSYYKKAIESWAKYNSDELYKLGEEYNNYTLFLIKTSQYDSAWNYNQKAEKIILQTYGAKSIYYSDIHLSYGDIFLKRNSEAVTIKDFRIKKRENLIHALTHYQKAANAVLENYNNEAPFVLPPIDNSISDIQLLTVLKKKANAFTLLAEIYQAEMDYDNFLRFSLSALQTINVCTNLIHRLRIGYLNEESKLILAEKQESTFLEAMDIAFRLYNFTKEKSYLKMAFEFTEKSKSASFLAAIKDMEAKQFGSIPDSLLKKEQYLKLYISNYKEKLYEENQKGNPDTQKTSLYSNKVFQYNEEHNRLIHLFEKDYPQYYKFKYENKVIDIEELQRQLTDKEAVIEYIVDEPTDSIHPGQLYRFIITKDEINLSQKNIGLEYVRNIEFLHSFLSSQNYVYTRKKDYTHYCKAAYRLYNDLLEPIESIIQDKRIAIIPDDKLSYLPFDALLSSMPDTSQMNFRDLPYLIYKYPISYSYSSTLLFNYFEENKIASRNLLAFAPDYLAYPPKQISGEKPQHLSPLPGALHEIDLLNNHLPSKRFSGAMASESNFKRIASDYDILHLAMHTIVNDSLPMFSKLAFSSTINDTIDDGWLNTHEIYNMKLKARMAVLSACNTGSGKLQKGEGVMSLARGFLYAGCPSIIMTLWEVEDLSGTEIMSNFYKYLSKGKDKDEALRLAKLQHLKNADPLKAHPHYWLGYVNVGNPDALYDNKDIYLIILVSMIILLVSIDQIYRYRKNRRK